MSRFTAINLSAMAAPDIIEAIDFEVILQELVADLVARYPDISGYIDLESEPARMLLETFAYRETILRARINDASRAVLLASATGNDLDHVGALFQTPRMQVEGVGGLEDESDARYRLRLQLAPDAFSVAGPEGAYRFHALSVAPWARDVLAFSPKPGVVRVVVLRVGAEPRPTNDELRTVFAYLAGPSIRPLTDVVQVVAPQVRKVDIRAELTLYPGPDSSIVTTAATTALTQWLEQNRMLGMNLRRSAIYAKLHQEGVHSVNLLSPAEDMVLSEQEVYEVSSIKVIAKNLRDQ